MSVCPGLLKEGRNDDSEGNGMENNESKTGRMVMLTARHDIRHLSFIRSANPHSSAMRKYCFYPLSQMRNQAWKRSSNYPQLHR